MIIPSIDLQNGTTVQLVGGKERALDAGNPEPIAARFGLTPEIAVVDLDGAMGRGDNRALIEPLCRRHAVRVGGGIRSVAAARAWLDAGAERVVIGTAAEPALVAALPRERVIVALDAVDGEVVVDGWRTRTGASIAERMQQLRELAGGFLVTFVEKEGRLGGTAMDRVAPLVEAAGSARLTIAGGVTTAEEIAALDRMGVDAQVGMALYTGRIGLAEALAAPLVSDRADGLWPTVVVDEHGRALGLCYSNLESLSAALSERRGIYWSRKRGLWRKGETSGARQELLGVALDCDRDALRFMVRQHGDGFCHLGSQACWGEMHGLAERARLFAERSDKAPAGSYTRRLLEDPALLASKLREEAEELAEAATPQEVCWEAADVLYFTMVAMARRGVALVDVERELARRAKRVTRRSEGNSA
jgi:phosphoribosylformimino-5-aminoimidazole carboxamide ribotide isomerase